MATATRRRQAGARDERIRSLGAVLPADGDV